MLREPPGVLLITEVSGSGGSGQLGLESGAPGQLGPESGAPGQLGLESGAPGAPAARRLLNSNTPRTAIKDRRSGTDFFHWIRDSGSRIQTQSRDLGLASIKEREHLAMLPLFYA